MRTIGLLLCCGLLLSCTSSPLLRSARSDDAATFRNRLPSLLAQREVDADEAQQVALEILRRDVAHSDGQLDRSGLAELRPCAEQLDDALADRAERADSIGALAAMIRVEAGLDDPRRHASQVVSSEAGWRALGARALIDPEPAEAAAGCERARRLAEHGRWRRKLMADPSARVRRGALRAAAVARDPHDVPALLEAARVDPVADVRALAIDAAAAIGGREVTLALNDVWPRADESTRAALARGWARLQPTVPEARARLVRVTQRSRGRAAVIAALALLAGEQPEHARADVVTTAAVLARRIGQGPVPVRVLAIDRAPLDWPGVAEAVAEARDDPDAQVAVAAWRRALEQAELREKALAALRERAGVVGPAGRRAKRTLAAAGDPTVVTRLAEDAKRKSPSDRSAAGVALARVGALRRSVALLGDADARVRATVGCSLIRLDEPSP